MNKWHWLGMYIVQYTMYLEQKTLITEQLLSSSQNIVNQQYNSYQNMALKGGKAKMQIDNFLLLSYISVRASNL